MQPKLSARWRWFSWLARLDESRPWTVLAVSVALAILSIWYTQARLEFRTGQDDLVSADTRDSRNYLRYEKEFPDLDGLIVVVSASPSRTRAEQFTETLAQRLNADRANVKSVFYRIDPALMGASGLLYLDTSDLARLAEGISANLPLLQGYGSDPTLTTLFMMANRSLDRVMRAHLDDPRSPAGSEGMAGLARLDPILAGMLADPDVEASSLWDALLSPGIPSGAGHDTYLLSANGRYLLLHIAPGSGVPHGPDPVKAIAADLEAVRASFPDIEAGMTGGPALAYAEQATTQHDMVQGSFVAVIGLVLLLVIPFRGVVEPFFAILALLIGGAWSFGFTTLAVGHLNLLSAVFTSVLVGIGINFPIHLMARYDEARRKGLAMPAALELAVVNTGTGVFASACIMALAFLMPHFTDFRGIAELGEISAAGLSLCLIAALLVFPALIALRERKAGARPPFKISMAPRRSTLEKLFARPGVIVAVTTVATLAAAVLIRGVTFDQNVLRLQANGAEAVRYENILLRDSGRSSWFAVALASTQAGADRKAAAFRQLPEVSSVETIDNYIPADQTAKLGILNRVRRELESVTIAAAPPHEGPVSLSEALSQFASRLDPLAQQDQSGIAARTRAMVTEALAKLKGNPNAFAAYESRIATDLRTRLELLKHQLAPTEITAQNLPRVLRDRFIGASGLYLVQVYPKGDVWADAPLKRFVTALRAVDRDVTGPPVQTYTLANVMRHGYERAAVLALIAVFAFVFADFRNLRDTVLATVPLVFGGLWLLEAMAALGWEFNLANLFAVPIIIGMGVDNGVNMLYRWREERDKSSLILTKAVGKSVTICSLTTIAAFAALIPASHRGISSLGWVMTLGVGFILLATLIVLPALFELLGPRLEHVEERSVATADSASESVPVSRQRSGAVNPPHTPRASGVL